MNKVKVISSSDTQTIYIALLEKIYHKYGVLTQDVYERGYCGRGIAVKICCCGDNGDWGG